MRHPLLKPLEDAGLKATFDWMNKDYGIKCFFDFGRILSASEKARVTRIANSLGLKDLDSDFNDDNGTTVFGHTEVAK